MSLEAAQGKFRFRFTGYAYTMLGPRRAHMPYSGLSGCRQSAEMSPGMLHNIGIRRFEK